MSTTSQQYAYLAKDAYNLNYAVGVRPPGKEEEVTLNGVTYRILEHANNPASGYQGTVYQNKQSGEIIVAHRGTEPLREPLHDGGADAAMVFLRETAQVEDARLLTNHAVEAAAKLARRGQSPSVTVTGHSLGGTLAQITAHDFNLRGETFNAYGAGSLRYRTGSGGPAVVNHVVAGDAVSAASSHYGQVRIYANERDIATLQFGGAPALLATASALTAADHGIDLFLDRDSHGQPKPSILNAQAEQLAREHATVIGGYRTGVHISRSVLTFVGNDLEMTVDALRGPIAPGAPTGRQDPAPAPAAQPPALSYGAPGYVGPPSNEPPPPAALPPASAYGAPSRAGAPAGRPRAEASPFDAHPHLQALAQQVALALPDLPGQQHDRLTAGLALQAGREGVALASSSQVQAVQYQGRTLLRIDNPLDSNPFTNFIAVDSARFAQTPVEHTLAALQQQEQPTTVAPTQTPTPPPTMTM